jgi:O-antigen ligase
LAKWWPLAILIAALGALVPLPGVRFLAVCGSLALLALWRPLWALALLPAAVAFGSLIQFSWHGINIGPTDLLLAALALCWLWRAGRTQLPLLARALPRTPAAVRGMLVGWWRARPLLVATFVVLGTYLLVIAASGLVAVDRAAVAKEAIKWLEVIVAVALVLWVVRAPGAARWLVWALILTGVAQALLGDAQWSLSAGDLGPGGASLRVFGTFGQPNPYAGFLNFALLPAVAIVIWGSDARERWAAGAAAALILQASLLADSRGALLGLGVSIICMLVVGLQRERPAAWVALVSVPALALAWAAGLLPTGLLARLRLSMVSLSGPVNDANFSDVERLAHWVAGLRMFAAHPLLGVGAGNFDAAYARYAVPGWPEPLGHAHNYYINAAAETGVLGLLAFLAVAAVALTLGWRTARARLGLATAARRPAVGAEADLALGLLAVVVAVLVHSLTDDLFVHAMELTFALCLGLLLALRAHIMSSASIETYNEETVGHNGAMEHT